MGATLESVFSFMCLFASRSVCLCLCLCLFASLSVCLCLCLCLFASLSMCLCLCLCLSFAQMWHCASHSSYFTYAVVAVVCSQLSVSLSTS